MFAIEFNEANFPKILHTDTLTVAEAQALSDVFITRDYVFIRGYYSDRHQLEPWAIMPKFFFEKYYEFDPAQIKTDWDQIVRV